MRVKAAPKVLVARSKPFAPDSWPPGGTRSSSSATSESANASISFVLNQPNTPRSRSGPVAGDARLVDLVDLLRVEEHLGVALVDLALDEHVEQVRVDVAVLLHAAEDLKRLGQRLALLVGTVLGGERLEDVGDAHAARLHRHLLAREALRVALAVHALVVAAGVLGHVGQVLRPRQRLEHLDGRDDVVVDDLAL